MMLDLELPLIDIKMQLKESLICWKLLTKQEPIETKHKTIFKFTLKHSMMPLPVKEVPKMMLSVPKPELLKLLQPLPPLPQPLMT